MRYEKPLKHAVYCGVAGPAFGHIILPSGRLVDLSLMERGEGERKLAGGLSEFAALELAGINCPHRVVGFVEVDDLPQGKVVDAIANDGIVDRQGVGVVYQPMTLRRLNDGMYLYMRVNIDLD